MVLEVYNTLTAKKEPFVPIKHGKVSMYVCGITPYSSSHIGHARCYVVWDTLRRFLKYSGYDVQYVQNFTDIDDKIINKANELGMDPFELSKKYIEEYFDEFEKLNVSKASCYPKVTEHISEIVKIISKLIEKGYAYENKGDVFYNVSKFRDYGYLSNQDLKELIKGKRVEINPNKKNPADFALWKSAKQGEPFWVSPWGNGRPGWHIECSAMAKKYLGEQFDLHCGGQDLIFPHHENEIAQSEAASGKSPFSKYWMHNGFVTIRKEKMAKSAGNMLPLNELLTKYDGESVRFFLLQTQYRQPLDYNDESVMQARDALANLKNAIDRISKIVGDGKIKKPSKYSPDLEKIRKKFISAMENDLNTPYAFSELYALRDLAFEKMAEFENNGLGMEDLQQIKSLFAEFGSVLGLFEQKSEAAAKISNEKIAELISLRNAAKKMKNWPEADRIREELKNSGVILEDNKDGSTNWHTA